MCVRVEIFFENFSERRLQKNFRKRFWSSEHFNVTCMVVPYFVLFTINSLGSKHRQIYVCTYGCCNGIYHRFDLRVQTDI
jgi:hypothetical protein